MASRIPSRSSSVSCLDVRTCSSRSLIKRLATVPRGLFLGTLGSGKVRSMIVVQDISLRRVLVAGKNRTSLFGMTITPRWLFLRLRCVLTKRKTPSVPMHKWCLNFFSPIGRVGLSKDHTSLGFGLIFGKAPHMRGATRKAGRRSSRRLLHRG